MQEELNNFNMNEVWSLVERSKQNIMETKWVFRNKQDEYRWSCDKEQCMTCGQRLLTS
jgi:hypothetical protein